MDYSARTPLAQAAAIARNQHGLINVTQLRSCGWSKTATHDAVRRGLIFTTPFTGVFSVGTPITTAYQRAMAAVLATNGLVSHHWCRWLFGVGRLPGHPPDVTAPASRHRREGLTLHRARTMPRADANDGIPCTRPERMVVDCAPDLTPKDLRRLVNDVQIRRLATYPTLRAELHATSGRATRALGALLADTPKGATRSLLEDLLEELSDERGLPAPAINAVVDGYEVDFSYHDGAVIVEADGYAFHSTRQQFEDDREKWLALEANGRRVLPVSYRQLTELRDETADRLTAILRPAPIRVSPSPKPATSPGAPPVSGRVPAGTA